MRMWNINTYARKHMSSLKLQCIDTMNIYEVSSAELVSRFLLLKKIVEYFYMA